MLTAAAWQALEKHAPMLLLFCFILKQLQARVQEQQTSIQSACHWIIPAFQKSVEYHPVQDSDFTSPAKKKKRIEDAIAITSSTELSSYEETVATPKPNTQKKTMKCPNSIHRTHVYTLHCTHVHSIHLNSASHACIVTRVTTSYARALYFVRAYAPPHYCIITATKLFSDKNTLA